MDELMSALSVSLVCPHCDRHLPIDTRELVDEAQAHVRAHLAAPTSEHDLPIDPDCQAGKHRACLGETYDELLDKIVECGCPCHSNP